MSWLIYLIASSGFLLGIILALISPEELKPGKKYFMIAKFILLFLVILFSLGLFIYSHKYWLLLIPLFYLILYLFLIRKFIGEDLFNYPFFLVLLFMLNLDLVLATLIFLYGLIAGTVFKLKLKEREEEKYHPHLKYVGKRS